VSAKRKKKAEAPAAGPTFTPAQQVVIEHNLGLMLVGAVAGSGKSTTLIERTARLAQSGVPLDKICLLAFNVDAATQLNRKLKKRLGLKGDVTVARTLHSLAHSIWSDTSGARGFTLDKNGSLQNRAIREAVNTLGIRQGTFDLDVVRRFSSRVKNDMLVTDEVVDQRLLGLTAPQLLDAAEAVIRAKRDCAQHPDDLIAIFFAAETVRDTQGVLLHDNATRARFVGFDDLLVESVRAFDRDPGLLARWQEQFDYVVVDEAQDLCEAQWRIVDALARRTRNLTIVGDPGQCIYSFRGARPEHFLAFAKRPNVRVVYMEHNFRSASKIIESGNIALAGIPLSARLPMKMIGTRSDVGFLGYRVHDAPSAEAVDLARNINAHHESGIEWRDQAILLRVNAQSAPIELELLKAKIPCRVAAGASFFAAKATKVVLAYMRVIANRADHSDFTEAILSPTRYLGRVFTDAVTKAAPQETTNGFDWIDLMEGLSVVHDRRYTGNAHDFMWKVRDWRTSLAKNATPRQLFEKICKVTDFGRWIASASEAEPDVDAGMNFDRVVDFMSAFNTLAELLDTVDELHVAQRRAAASRNAVTISTVHRVKGAEWQVVYMPGMTSKIWPVPWGNPTDERRLLYVAVTRAAQELWFYSHAYADDATVDEVTVSPYLPEFGVTPTEEVGKRVAAPAGQLSLI